MSLQRLARQRRRPSRAPLPLCGSGPPARLYGTARKRLDTPRQLGRRGVDGPRRRLDRRRRTRLARRRRRPSRAPLPPYGRGPPARLCGMARERLDAPRRLGRRGVDAPRQWLDRRRRTSLARRRRRPSRAALPLCGPGCPRSPTVARVPRRSPAAGQARGRRSLVEAAQSKAPLGLAVGQAEAGATPCSPAVVRTGPGPRSLGLAALHGPAAMAELRSSQVGADVDAGGAASVPSGQVAVSGGQGADEEDNHLTIAKAWKLLLRKRENLMIVPLQHLKANPWRYQVTKRENMVAPTQAHQKGQGVAPINQRHFPLISLPTKINLGRPRLKRELHSKQKRKSLAKRR